MVGGRPDRTPGERGAEPRRPRVGRARALFHRAFPPRTTPDSAEIKDSGIGRLLCSTRMRLGKDLQYIAQVLHIRYTYLVAIEDGRYEDLPGQAYAIGFLRAYADHLGLDGDEVVRRFKDDSTGLRRKAALDFPIPAPDTGIPSGLSLLAAMLMGMTIYGAWYAIARPARTFPLVQELPARLTTPKVEAAAEQAPLPAAEAQPQEQLSAAPPAPTTAVDPSAPPPELAQPVAAAPAVPPPAPEKFAENDKIELRAKVDSWIQVRRGDALLLTKLLRKGDVYRVPERGLTLMTANAGGIEIVVNGEVMPPLGENGAVASGIPLEPEHFKSEED